MFDRIQIVLKRVCNCHCHNKYTKPNLEDIVTNPMILGLNLSGLSSNQYKGSNTRLNNREKKLYSEDIKNIINMFHITCREDNLNLTDKQKEKLEIMIRSQIECNLSDTLKLKDEYSKLLTIQTSYNQLLKEHHELSVFTGNLCESFTNYVDCNKKVSQLEQVGKLV